MDEEENQKDSFHKLRTNGMYLSDAQIELLKRYDIDYRKYPNLKSLIFRIEEELNEGDIADTEELDLLSEELQTFSYYHDTHK